MNCSLPGASIQRISQARILEWVASASSGRSSHSRDWTRVSCGFCIDWGVLYHWATWAVHNSECLGEKADLFFFFFLFLTHSFVLAIAYTLILARRRKANLVYFCVQITSKPEGNWLRQTLEHDFLKDYCLKIYQSVVKRWEQISTKKYRFPWQSISHFILLKKNLMIPCTEAFLEWL